MTDHGPFTAQVDQAHASIRDWLDKDYQLHGALLRERSPWHDGARFIVHDLITHRSDPNELLTRLWAWDAFLEAGDG